MGTFHRFPQLLHNTKVVMGSSALRICTCNTDASLSTQVRIKTVKKVTLQKKKKKHTKFHRKVQTATGGSRKDTQTQATATITADDWTETV